MPFSRGELDGLLALAEPGIATLVTEQAAVLAEPAGRRGERHRGATTRFSWCWPRPTPTRPAEIADILGHGGEGRAVAPPGRGGRGGGDRRDPGGQRPAEGPGPGQGHRAGGGGRRHRPRGRRPGGRPRGVLRPLRRARAPPTPTTSAGCWTSWRPSPTGEGPSGPVQDGGPGGLPRRAGDRSEGMVEGTIAGAARRRRGFGYDPVFVPDEGAGRHLRRDDLRREARSRTGGGPSGPWPPCWRSALRTERSGGVFQPAVVPLSATGLVGRQ